jgi:hypothetical protein
MNGATRSTDAVKTMPAMRSIGIIFLALAAGCAGLKEAPPGVAAQAEPMTAEPSRVGPTRDGDLAEAPPRSGTPEDAVVASTPPTAGPRQPATAAGEAIGTERAAAATAPPAPPSRSQGAAKAALPPAKAPAKVSATAVAAKPPIKNEEPGPVARATEPPLDVAALKGRLRDTDAIGVFTKLALKNQVDDLLEQFRTCHEGGQKTSVASLRQPYNMLVLKVLSLVQDNDPSLARTISGSREAIWIILADPEKFHAAI